MEHPLHEAPSHRLSALRCWEFGVPGLAPQDRGLGFRALGFRVLGFRVLGFRVMSRKAFIRAWGLGFRA